MTISVVQRESNKWVKVFKNGPRKFVKFVLHKFYLVHS